MMEPMEKVPKLTENWCEEVAKEEHDNKENQEDEAMEEDAKVKDDAIEKQPEHGSVPYFRWTNVKFGV